MKKLQSEKLIYLGVFLFLLGLIVGLVVPILANPRMGVSSHLEGVMNGILLIVLGLIWEGLHLSDKALTRTYWLALYGTFVNWFGVLLAAIFDSGAMMSIAANGKQGPPFIEGLVTFSLLSLSIAMIIVSISVLIGLKRGSIK